MKKIFFVFSFLALIMSCEKEEAVIQEGNLENSPMRFKSASTFNIDDYTDVPLYLMPAGGITNDRTYLSVNPDGSKCDLWHEDDNSGRQKWMIIKKNGYYQIRTLGGTPNGRYLLSTNPDGTKVDLWDTDDGSGRQRWNFTHLYSNVCQIKIGASMSRKYLSTTDNGSKVDLYYNDNLSGRQRWIIQDAGTYELISIEYSNPPMPTAQPAKRYNKTIKNTTSTAAEYTLNLSKTSVETSKFEETNGMSISAKSTFTVDIPSVGSASVETAITGSKTATYGQTDQASYTESESLKLLIEPGKEYTTSIILYEYSADVQYTATFKNLQYGTIKTVEGIWTGVQHVDTDIIIKDTNTGQVVKSYRNNFPSGTIIVQPPSGGGGSES